VKSGEIESFLNENMFLFDLKSENKKMLSKVFIYQLMHNRVALKEY